MVNMYQYLIHVFDAAFIPVLHVSECIFPEASNEVSNFETPISTIYMCVFGKNQLQILGHRLIAWYHYVTSTYYCMLNIDQNG